MASNKVEVEVSVTDDAREIMGELQEKLERFAAQATTADVLSELRADMDLMLIVAARHQGFFSDYGNASFDVDSLTPDKARSYLRHKWNM